MLAFLPAGGAIANTIARGLPRSVLDALPATAEGSPALFMFTYPARGERLAEAIGALSAETFRYALRGGFFLSCNAGEMAAQVSQAIGMTPIPDVGVMSIGPRSPVDGWVLDIGRIGSDAWLDAVTSGNLEEVARLVAAEAGMARRCHGLEPRASRRWGG